MKLDEIFDALNPLGQKVENLVMEHQWWIILGIAGLIIFLLMVLV